MVGVGPMRSKLSLRTPGGGSIPISVENHAFLHSATENWFASSFWKYVRLPPLLFREECEG